MVKTLELYNALKDRIGEEGTRVIIEAFDEVDDKGHANLATKEDIATVKEDIATVKEDIATVKVDIVKLDSKIDKVELTLRAEIEKSKSDLLRWMFIFWASQIGIIIALIKLLP